MIISGILYSTPLNEMSNISTARVQAWFKSLFDIMFTFQFATELSIPVAHFPHNLVELNIVSTKLTQI